MHLVSRLQTQNDVGRLLLKVAAPRNVEIGLCSSATATTTTRPISFAQQPHKTSQPSRDAPAPIMIEQRRPSASRGDRFLRCTPHAIFGALYVQIQRTKKRSKLYEANSYAKARASQTELELAAAAAEADAGRLHVSVDVRRLSYRNGGRQLES